MLRRLSGPLEALTACGIARHAEPGVIELFLSDAERADGGMVTISMRVPVRDKDGRSGYELWSAWLAVPPGVQEGERLVPSALLPGMVRPVSFRVRPDSAA
jgi:hypothetical protein